jgi:hypothetical protein
LDLAIIWNKQGLPEQVESSLIALAELVLLKITDTNRKVGNVTQWCKRQECWDDVKTITFKLPTNLKSCLITIDDEKAAQRSAKKEQKVVNEINAQVEVVKYTAAQWTRLSEFVVRNHLVGSRTDVSALTIACRIPEKLPNAYQSKRLLALLQKAIDEGFNINQ